MSFVQVNDGKDVPLLNEELLHTYEWSVDLVRLLAIRPEIAWGHDLRKIHEWAEIQDEDSIRKIARLVMDLAERWLTENQGKDSVVQKEWDLISYARAQVAKHFDGV